ncbi:hypothetical protein GCK72_009806 [Caenorhabditis remanei]|uniref:Uncharacterized protein n=1 Tax=Caenorhabditis remanei TaxID=31234 RepID=A0A6A5H185_CAERE|nr:hypothetical protein GCK72_009806 [Caenorhabditis remanei]KAF1761550.1 hypothetical protein GCK72_009806 [Caenorhabditis remanei]
MIPSENADDEDNTRKPSRPFLKKGEGTARFRMTNSGKRSGAIGNPQSTSPAISLPRFTPMSLPPYSARTVDSGISYEDETRPPTTASLPMDQPSTSTHSPPHNSEYFTNGTPAVVEEHEDNAHRVEDHEEYVERVSAMPSFVPDDGTSSSVEPCSQISEDAVNLRLETERREAQAKMANSMKSVSITPSSYSSDISRPQFHSTPKGSVRSDITDDPIFLPPSLMPSKNHSFGTLSSASLETPQARPLTSNRLNLQAQSEAQTGLSLLKNGSNFQAAPSRNLPRIPSTNQEQKENIAVDHVSIQSEHVYDQPLQVPGLQRQQRLIAQKQKHNMLIQLRDTIANLDFATEGVWSTKKKLEEDYKRLIMELENKRKELEEEFQRKVETIQEDNNSENERLKRERRDIERDRKILQKGTGERQKELTEMIATLREKLAASETQNSKLRQDIRARDDKLKKKDEEIEKLTKDYTRSKNTCQTLEKRIKQLRTERDRDDKEKELFAKVALNRKTSYPTVLNQSLAIEAPTSSRLPSVSSLAINRKSTSVNKGRTVSFADEPHEQSLEVINEDIPPELVMKPYRTTSTSTIYCDSLGETSKVTQTVANGILFQYPNGDMRWMNRQNSVNIYRFSMDKTVAINLVQFNISIIYSLQRQLEVLRPGGNATLISVKRREVRTELHCREDGTYYTEIFDRNGRFVTKDYCHPEVARECVLGSPYSFRDNGTRYVEYTTPEDFELVEPEFRLRWYQGKVMACKIIGRPHCNEKTLRVQVDLTTGNGIMEMVESQLKDGQSQKKTVFQWPSDL